MRDKSLPTASNTAPPIAYFSRQLKRTDAAGEESRIDEHGLLALSGNTVILGEPGMGKSALIRELGRRLDVDPVTAIRLINARNPARLVQPGKPLLIDGLDEAMARREGDAVDAVLAQLEAAGSPTFVLSCRSREWQSRGASNLRQLYGADPHILELQPFDRSEADAFLRARHPGADADQVIAHLADHGLEDLYRNPLTLDLMGRVAESDAQLPATRAALFTRVCALIWSEHDPDRQDQGLAQLNEDDALDAAGAIAAGMLLAGAEAASAAGAAQVQPGDIRIADLEALPAAKAARAIFSSKLFQSTGPSRAKPIHRVIAEFLGARWLARQARTPRTQRRLLAQLQGGGAVPASLRGLHAWLAYHSPAMAECVITADPYGTLLYGEAAALTPSLAGAVVDALCSLAQDDPYFRGSAWDAQIAAGLMVPALRSKIEAIIGSTDSNGHLRCLLIEGLEDTALAGELANTLAAIVLSPDRFYRERWYAAKALIPHRNIDWWRASIATLTDELGEDAPRLARNLIELLGADVSDDLLVATVFAEMGLTGCRLPRHAEEHSRTLRYYGRLVDVIPADRLVGVLAQFADYAELVDNSDWEASNDIVELVSHLLVRAIDEGKVGSAEAPLVWRCLAQFERDHGHHHDHKLRLAERLTNLRDLRRAIQTHVLKHDRRENSLWITNIDLFERLVGLSLPAGDVVYFLDCLASGDVADPTLRQDWMDLVSLGRGPDGLDAEVRAAADRFRRGDKSLGDFLTNIENPEEPAWAIEKAERDAKRTRERQTAFEAARREFAGASADLRAGSLGAIVNPAKAYFARFSDLPRDAPPRDRLATWLGPDLRDDALVGFEATLHRADLPTPAEIAAGFAGGSIYNYAFPVMAGLYERLRNGKGIADLPAPVKLAGLLLSHDDHGWNLAPEKDALRAVLEAAVISTPDARRAFARLWIEPSLAAGKQHVAGLYMLAHEPDWQETGAALAAEWLVAYPKLPETVEAGLVDCLTRGGALDALRDVARVRDGAVFRNFDHMLSWLAIDVLVRFEDVRPDLAGIGADCPEFLWFLRNRLQLEHRGATLPLAVAQAEWIIAEFREHWPYATLEGSGSGDHNAYDATDFLRSLITRIADDTSVEAAEAMARLIAGPSDSYAQLIRHMAAEQRQKRAEENFAAIPPDGLAALLDDGPPGNIDDLRALVREELAVAQRKLIGDDIDSVAVFWNDAGIPRDENSCRDRLAAMIGADLARYDIQRITEADMPQTKRADLAFARGSMQLAVEVKGQWHPDVWDAATGQLDAQYLIDWRSEQRGIYCVLWFGDLPSASGRRLKAHPDGLAAPQSAAAMRSMLIDRIPAARRPLIDVVVLDLSSGRP